jgi:serine/threonine protein kinase
MPLPSGDKVGPYEILAHVGKGGLGEVYRALDTNLSRDVAIIHGLKNTATNARSISEEEVYETTPMDSLVAHIGSRDPSQPSGEG